MDRCSEPKDSLVQMQKPKGEVHTFNPCKTILVGQSLNIGLTNSGRPNNIGQGHWWDKNCMITFLTQRRPPTYTRDVLIACTWIGPPNLVNPEVTYYQRFYDGFSFYKLTLSGGPFAPPIRISALQCNRSHSLESFFSF